MRIYDVNGDSHINRFDPLYVQDAVVAGSQAAFQLRRRTINFGSYWYPESTTGYARSDLTRDGLYDARDVVQAINGVAEYRRCRADVNRDGLVNALDAVATINAISASGNSCYNATGYRTYWRYDVDEDGCLAKSDVDVITNSSLSQ